MYIPAPRKVNYIQAKAYCHIGLLSFTQNTVQKLVTRNITDERGGMYHSSIAMCPQTKNSTETAVHDVITHTQEAVVNRKLHLTFPRG